ncbi:MAG: glucokinase [Erythrobacter sp.]
MTRTIAVADIGGTNARFAVAEVAADGAINLREPEVLATSGYPDLASAWRVFWERSPGFTPDGAALALAGPASQGVFKLTNANWRFDPAKLPAEMGIERLVLLNDFEAVAHAIASEVDGDNLVHIGGPSEPLPSEGTVTVIGPGTGLGIAHYRKVGALTFVQPTEGSHIDFAPVDAVDDAMLTSLRKLYDRVSLERVISGDGIAHIYAAIAGLEGVGAEPADPVSIWTAGLSGDDPLAARAVTHFVKTLGRASSDYALAHGASGLVIAGGIGLRLRDHLASKDFNTAFENKGRYQDMMRAIPRKLIIHTQPGLLGAATAYLKDHPSD